ncbi:MAG: 2-oxo acid dehydrogenase subunit E2 [Gammaproteobacteria bacterium]|nr:2-oxo acid dehydrogenase subunit E2 [Gammaproteobacteria bacterium]
MAAPVEVTVPDIGDFSDVEVIELLVKAGDVVAPEDPLIGLESDKATMEVPAPAAGTVRELKVAVGDRVSEGALILLLEPAAESPSSESVPPSSESAPSSSEPKPSPPESPPPSTESKPPPAPSAPSPAPPPAPPSPSAPHASPGVHRFARELGADLSGVAGSGPHQRVLEEDVKEHIRGRLAGGGALPGVPAVDFARFGEVEVKKIGRIKKISGPRLHASWLNIPHVTHHDDADITELEQLRQSLKDKAAEKNIRLTNLAFITKALAYVLAAHPDFNASFAANGQSIVYKKYIHIGIAVDTAAGLMVPVLRDADKKTVLQLAAEMAELSARARDGKIKAEEMQGGSITITSIGGIGGTAFTPIINAPEAAILGITRARMRPQWNGETFAPRLMLPLDLSYDHRLIDGAEAARFTAELCRVLGNIQEVLL